MVKNCPMSHSIQTDKENIFWEDVGVPHGPPSLSITLSIQVQCVEDLVSMIASLILDPMEVDDVATSPQEPHVLGISSSPSCVISNVCNVESILFHIVGPVSNLSSLPLSSPLLTHGLYKLSIPPCDISSPSTSPTQFISYILGDDSSSYNILSRSNAFF